MRILHVITGLGTGGAEKSLYRLLAADSSGDNIHIVFSLTDDGVYGEPIRELGVTVYSMGIKKSLSGLLSILCFLRAARRQKPDLVQGWMYHGNLAGSMLKSICWGTPLIWCVRQSLYDLDAEKRLTRLVIYVSRIMSRYVNLILYNSEKSRMQHEKFGFSAKRSQVVPNGFKTETYSFEHDQTSLVRKQLGIPSGCRVVGNVARFHPMKDHGMFLRAGVRLACHDASVHFLCIGSGVTYDNEFMKNQIPDKHKDRFLLLGERKDIPELLNGMDVYCQSSWSEAFPNALAEAMLSGLVCIATDVGDAEIIMGDTGFIVPARDDEAMYNALRYVISMPNDELGRLGQRARKNISGRYGIDQVVRRYREIYEVLK